MDDAKNWPAWRYGPDGAADVFQRAADVPEGWQDHPSKVISPAVTGSKPVAEQTDQVPPAQRGAEPLPAGNDVTTAETGAGSPNTGDKTNDLDAHGWPWSAELHAATQTKTKDGLWRMKVGVSRPDPKPGFPKPPLDL